MGFCCLKWDLTLLKWKNKKEGEQQEEGGKGGRAHGATNNDNETLNKWNFYSISGGCVGTSAGCGSDAAIPQYEAPSTRCSFVLHSLVVNNVYNVGVLQRRLYSTISAFMSGADNKPVSLL